MRLYEGDISTFRADVLSNKISDKLVDSYKSYYSKLPVHSEIRSWNNSLRALNDAIAYTGLNDNMIALEYELPYSSRRIDCLFFGKGEDNKENAVIVELKQWEDAKELDIEGNFETVETYTGGSIREVPHPSSQIEKYTLNLKDSVVVLQEEPKIELYSCSYCHNYIKKEGKGLFSDRYKELLKDYPIFTKNDIEQLSKYLKNKLQRGDGFKVFNRFSESEIAPSKKLAEHFRGVIKENKEVFHLIDDQLAAYNTIVDRARRSNRLEKKSVIIIKGGPGTGKSVIAINTVQKLLSEGIKVYHATGSKAFTESIRKLVGSRAAILFKYFNTFSKTKSNEINVLIMDEAHRIRKSSNNRYTKKEERSEKPQIEELIDVAKVSVFFIDDDQVVRPDEIGSVSLIKDTAKKFDAEVFEYQLETQFRCNGSNGYMEWVDNTLGIKETANKTLTKNEKVEFKIFENPKDLYNAIMDKNTKNHPARMVAGFCWKWSDTKSDGTLNEDVIVGDFKMTWEAKNESRKLAPGIPKAMYWAIDPNGVSQCGSIYTIQGFEFDYVGVIFGKDLVYDPIGKIWLGKPENSADSSAKRAKGDFIKYAKNAYRVLLTRGMKGCYVHFMDKNTENFFKSKISNEEGLF